jgi:hypothetical protein
MFLLLGLLGTRRLMRQRLVIVRVRATVHQNGRVRE